MATVEQKREAQKRFREKGTRKHVACALSNEEHARLIKKLDGKSINNYLRDLILKDLERGDE